MLSSRLLANFVYEYKYDIDDKSLEKSVRERIFDFIVSAIAGKKINSVFNDAITDILLEENSLAQASVLFSKNKLSVTNAAFLNAIYGHGADLDDGHKTANGHPGVATIPAILALAEKYNSDKFEIYEAIIVAYEIYIRLSNAVQPSLLRRGFHGTGVVGAVAASAGCAKLLKLNEDSIHSAMSLAAVQASGLFEISESGQMCKPINPANACRTGVLSALLAQKGVTAPDNPFEGNKGFFKAFSDNVNLEAISENLGKKLLIDTSYLKLYPSCRHTHPCIDAGHNIRMKRKIVSSQIEKIIISTYGNAILVTGNIIYPKTMDDAKFSMRYCLARSLLTGNYTLDDLDVDKNLDQETRDLISKMEIVSDEKYENKEKKIRGAMVRVIFTNNEKIEEYVPLPIGDPDFAVLKVDDFKRKLQASAKGYICRNKQDELFDYFFYTNEFELEVIYSFLSKESK